MNRLINQRRIGLLLLALGLNSAATCAIWAHPAHGSGTRNAPSPASKKSSKKILRPVIDLNLADRPMQPRLGGQVTATKEHYFEVVYLPKETRIYIYSASQRRIGVKRMNGEVLMQVNGQSQVHRYPVQEMIQNSLFGDPGYLVAVVDVSRVRDGDMQVTFDLKGLPLTKERNVRFAQMFYVARPRQRQTVRPVSHQSPQMAGLRRQFAHGSFVNRNVFPVLRRLPPVPQHEHTSR